MAVLQARPPMLVSYRWLCELLPQLRREPEEVADALSAVGLAVDGVADFGSMLRPLVIAEVLQLEPHPERSGLQLVTVRTCAEETQAVQHSLPPQLQSPTDAIPAQVTVVCGAKNVPAPGGLVVLAYSGVKLPGVDFVLTRREIGGVFSEGMLCSESELGLADSSAGLFTFQPGFCEPGTRFIDAYPEARDVIFELDVTPNRPDALGHVGIARDLAAFFEVEFKLPECPEVAEGGPSAGELVQVVNEAPERCPRYSAACVSDVRVKPSPDWMRHRLHRLGIRPISNLVDVTNWVLLEFGQPLHAFDASLVRDSKIVIRTARAGEVLQTLDGQERELQEDDLVIADGVGPTALAGVMGGAQSEVTETTRQILLECAHFEPRGIRRAARRHGMHTESSHRFERGTDHGQVEFVLNYARALLCQLGEGRAAPGCVRADGVVPEIPSIEFRSEQMDRLLGVDVPFKEATRILVRLGFEVEYVRDMKEGPVALIRGASHRPDVKIEADLIEEVARIRGLDNIPTVLPAIPPQERRSSGKLERDSARIAVELGLSEALTYAFVSHQELEAVQAPYPVVSLSNPLNEDRSVLRTSLLPGLLEALKRARRRGERRVQLFSVGAIFLSPETTEPASVARPRQVEDRGRLPIERPCFAALLAGPRAEHLALKPNEVDIYDAKAVALEFVERMTGRTARLERAVNLPHSGHLHPRGAAAIFVDDALVGKMGPLHPDVDARLDLDGPAYVVEIELSALETLGKRVPRYVPIPKVPSNTRDLSLLLRDDLPAAEVIRAIREAAGEICESVEVVSEFRGGSVPEGHRSLTFRAVYRDPLARQKAEQARTLTDKEVDAVMAQVVETTQRVFGASLR